MSAPRRLSPQTITALDAIIGAIFCASIAGITVAVLPKTEHKTTLPLVFIVVIAAMAKRYGALAGVLGSVSAALIFAYFLFTPEGALSVTNTAARNSLSWMLILGITASYFISFPEAAQQKRVNADSALPNDRQAA